MISRPRSDSDLLAVRLERWAFAALVTSLVSAPLGSNVSLPGHPSIFAFRIFFVLFVMLEGARLLLARPAVRVRHSLGVGVLLLLIAGWSALSIIWATERGAAVRYTIFLIQATILIWSIASYGRDRRRLAWLVLAAFASYVIVTGGALYERATGYRFPESMFRDPELNIRFLFSSFFHNSNDLATFLALWLPLFLVAYLYGRRLPLRAAGLGLTALSGVLIVMTLSRANTLSAAMAVLALLVFSLRRRLAAWCLLVGAMVLSMALMPALPRHFVSSAIVRLSQDVTQGAATTDTRVRLAEESLTLLKRSRGLGVGGGNVEANLKLLRAERRTQNTEILNMHNWWLELLVNLGVVGFALYLAFYLKLLGGLVRLHLRVRDVDPVLAAFDLALLASLVGFVIGCVSSSSVLTFNPIWIQFGLCLAALGLGRQVAPDGSTPAPVSEAR